MNPRNKTHIMFVDFSTSSSSICVYDIHRDNYYYTLIMNKWAFSKAKIFDMESHPLYGKLFQMGNVYPIVYDKVPMARPKGDQSEYCNKIILDCRSIREVFWLEVDKMIDGIDPNNIIVGWEDYAVAVSSNNAIQMGEMTSSCKLGLHDRFKPENILFFQPQLLKKSATGNGNATKAMMLDFFLLKTKGSPCPMAMMINENSTAYREVNGKHVKKPVEDIVDSYFGVNMIIGKYFK